jgi:hypothetical protein
VDGVSSVFFEEDSQHLGDRSFAQGDNELDRSKSSMSASALHSRNARKNKKYREQLEKDFNEEQMKSEKLRRENTLLKE